MILTRTPFRISFFGGGTDFPVWITKNGGAVLSASINKYSYISVRYLPPFFDYKFRIRYSRRELTQTVNEIRHPSVRGCLKYLKIRKGIEMVHTSDLPAKSGIGSSSAFTVGFLNALFALKGQTIAKRQLSYHAIHVEQNILKENVGCQDQIASTFGGFNTIEFFKDNSFQVSPIIINAPKQQYLEKHLMFFFTGFSRSSDRIIKEQLNSTIKGLKDKQLSLMQQMVEAGINILNGPTADYHYFGEMLHESWMLKQTLSSKISNPEIQVLYERARKAGAIGGKLCGAGGGGFLLLYVPLSKQGAVKESLKNLLHVPFCFERSGSQVIFYAPQQQY